MFFRHSVYDLNLVSIERNAERSRFYCCSRFVSRRFRPLRLLHIFGSTVVVALNCTFFLCRLHHLRKNSRNGLALHAYSVSLLELKLFRRQNVLFR